VLAMAACELVGGDVRDVVPAACAIEMIHTYSLIHDDLPALDNDELRRGRPTSHIAFGEAMAILAGDALLTLAFETVAGRTRDPRIAAELSYRIAAAAGIGGMVGGQVVDIDQDAPATKKMMEYVHSHKTAALIEVSVAAGAVAGRAKPAGVRALSQYGHCIGMAFQISDDVLDATSTPEELGKATQKDEAKGRLSAPSLFGIEKSKRLAGEYSAKAIASLKPFGKDARMLAAVAHYISARRK
jgi:geranylgeranyl diphosphate synthase type II